MKVKLHDKYSVLPTRKHPTDAGLDLYSRFNSVIKPGQVKVVDTGVYVKFPEGSMGLIKPKGRSDFLIGSGVIDQNYRGEIRVKIFNPLRDSIVIAIGDPIAQLVILPVLTPELELVDELDETDRGESGGIWKM